MYLYGNVEGNEEFLTPGCFIGLEHKSSSKICID